MGQNFIACDREQSFLLPPDVREWLPEDHFAWFVLDAVAQMDLAAFYGAYRADGHGRAAFDPGMVVALLLYAYARGTRSSRAIERAYPAAQPSRLCATTTMDRSSQPVRWAGVGEGLLHMGVARSRLSSPHRHTSPNQCYGTPPSASALGTGSARRCAGTGSFPYGASAWRRGQLALGGLTDDFCAPCWSVRRRPTHGS
jgi:hypothetical protein